MPKQTFDSVQAREDINGVRESYKNVINLKFNALYESMMKDETIKGFVDIEFYKREESTEASMDYKIKLLNSAISVTNNQNNSKYKYISVYLDTLLAMQEYVSNVGNPTISEKEYKEFQAFEKSFEQFNESVEQMDKFWKLVDEINTVLDESGEVKLEALKTQYQSLTNMHAQTFESMNKLLDTMTLSLPGKIFAALSAWHSATIGLLVGVFIGIPYNIGKAIGNRDANYLLKALGAPMSYSFNAGRNEYNNVKSAFLDDKESPSIFGKMGHYHAQASKHLESTREKLASSKNKEIKETKQEIKNNPKK